MEKIKIETNVYPILSSNLENIFAFEIQNRDKDVDLENMFSGKKILFLDKNIFISFDPIDSEQLQDESIKIKKLDKSRDELVMLISDKLLNMIYDKMNLIEENKHSLLLNDDKKETFHDITVSSGFRPIIMMLENGISFLMNDFYVIKRSVDDFIKSGRENGKERNYILNSLKNMNIITSYDGKNVKISNINWDAKVAEITVSGNDENTKISLTQFFQQKLNINISNEDVIIESIENNKKLLYPSSLLMISGLTNAENENKEIKDYVNKMKKSIGLEDLDTSIFSEYNLSFGDKIELAGTVLKPPEIVVKSKISNNEISINMDKFDFEKYNVVLPPIFNSNVLFLVPDNFKEIKDNFMKKFIDIGYKMGIILQNPDIIYTYGNYNDDIIKYIIKNGTPSFVIVITRIKNDPAIKSLRQLLTNNFGIPSSNVPLNLLSSVKFIYELLFQITTKAGGIPYYISPKSLPVKNTMIIGISKIDQFISMTSSYDYTFSRYLSKTYKENNDEIFVPNSLIKDFLKKSIDFYKKHSTNLLKRIIIYRSNVDYDQIDVIKEIEISAAKEIVNDIPLVYCLVDNKPDIKFSNAKVGTVVTNEITVNGITEFYITPTENRLTRYTIIYQAPVVWEFDRFIRLSHYLTYLYTNSSRKSTIPIPLKYANSLSKLSKSQINFVQPNDFLQTYVHYI